VQGCTYSGQLIKRYARGRVVKVVRRVVRGITQAIAKVLTATGGTVINTASIERLNATFRSAWHPWRAEDAPLLTIKRC
jgi:hypothetical protein